MMWLRQPAGHLNSMQFKSINSSIVAGIYAMGTGFQLGVYDGIRQPLCNKQNNCSYFDLIVGWEYLGHPGQWTTFMSELRIYPQLGLGTFSVNNGPSHIGNAPYNHRFLQNSIFSIVNGRSDLSARLFVNFLYLVSTISGLNGHMESHAVDQNVSRKKIVGEKLLKQLSAKRTPSQNMTKEAFVGIFGNPVEGIVNDSNRIRINSHLILLHRRRRNKLTKWNFVFPFWYLGNGVFD